MLGDGEGTLAPCRRLQDVLVITLWLSSGCGSRQAREPTHERRCNFAAETVLQEASNRRKKKRQSIVDLIGGSAAGLTRNELAAAVGSPTDRVSVMMHRINKELAGRAGRSAQLSSGDRSVGARRGGAIGSCRCNHTAKPGSPGRGPSFTAPATSQPVQRQRPPSPYSASEWRLRKPRLLQKLKLPRRQP